MGISSAQRVFRLCARHGLNVRGFGRRYLAATVLAPGSVDYHLRHAYPVVARWKDSLCFKTRIGHVEPFAI
jgi:hypothetical protein